MIETKNPNTLKEHKDLGLRGSGPDEFVSTANLSIAKKVTKEQLIEEERSLQKVEDDVAGKFRGLRGYWRLFEISRVIGMLSLYLYLDQLDL
ncbi:MAG: hypothetical protein ABIV48_03405, partial [Pyrinomonadaceae bacterium]